MRAGSEHDGAFLDGIRVFLMLAALFCPPGCSGADDGATPISTASTFHLSAEEVDELTRLAANGDADASYRLYEFYDFAKFDHEAALSWLRRSAESGNAVAQSNLGAALLELAEPGSAEELEAVHWLEQARSAGVTKAHEKLTARGRDDDSGIESREPPTVDANVVSVSVGPGLPGGRYRVVVTRDEIYHHIFVDWLSSDEDGEGPVRVASRYAVSESDLGERPFSIESLGELTWSGPSSVKVSVNEHKTCTLLLSENHYRATCAMGSVPQVSSEPILFDGEGFSVLVPPGASVQAERPTEDFVLYHFASDGSTFLSAYVGNQPTFPRAIEAAATETALAINGQPARLDSGARRECLIELCGEFPRFAHFWYEGASNPTRAEQIMRSVTCSGG